MQVTILNSEIVNNNTVIINDLATPYSAETGSTYEVFIGFSATSVSTIVLTIPNDYTQIGDYEAVKLIKSGNAPNLYALHLSLDKYYYNTGGSTARTMSFAMTVNSSSAQIYDSTSFNITQNGCWLPLYYTIYWNNYDSTNLETDLNVEEGTMPVYNGNTPTKPATAQYTFTFNGWSPSVSLVSGDTTYTAQFSQTVNTYPITWVDGDGNTLYTEQVAYGSTPSYTGNTPTKTATAQYSYTFTGWSPTVVAVTTAATYTAQFSQVVNTYTVLWKNYDSTTLETDSNVPYGTTPTYDGSTPTKPSTSSMSYVFTGWSPSVTAITGDTVYTAQYQSVPLYTITVLVTPSNEHGHLEMGGNSYSSLTISSIADGTEYEFSGNTLTIGSGNSAITINAVATVLVQDGIDIYSFGEWIDGSLTQGTISANTEFTALFRKVEYIEFETMSTDLTHVYDSNFYEVQGE